MLHLCLSLLLVCLLFPVIHTFQSNGKLSFHLPSTTIIPQLVLISGATGAGKSTFGMSVALNQGIIRCISTDSIREILRSCDYGNSFPPALHRSSFSGQEDPIQQWKECCEVLHPSMDGLIEDAMSRGVSMVLEGVHMLPSYANRWLERWRAKGGQAVGCVLMIKEEEAHGKLIFRRGEWTKQGEKAEQQKLALGRIRRIQEEMVALGQLHDWLVIEQQIEPSPLEIIQQRLAP